VLYFWLDWRPTACTYPASQCTHTNIHQSISPILELQCCTFYYIGGLQRVPIASLSMYTYKHQAISSIWSCSAVLLVRLEAYSVYLPSLSMYTNKHQAISPIWSSSAVLLITLEAYTPTQPLNVHIQTYIRPYPPFGATELYF
jgi:hypothetical protein